MGVFKMPSLGSDMESGTLAEWMVKPGDEVKRGDIVAVVETQKGAIEIECFEAGKVAELTADIGQTLPVGAPMAVILGAGETAPAPVTAPVAAESAQPAPKPGPAPPPAPPKPTPPSAPPGPTLPPPPSGPAPTPLLSAGLAASPAARRAAAERGIDLAALTGTGPGGTIQLADVEAAGATPAPAPDTKAATPLEAMRAAIAAAMARSKREIPHYYLAHTIDLQPASDWLLARNADRPPDDRLLLGALVFKAAAIAARKVPAVNGHYVDGAFVASDVVNAGLAVALRGGGLVAPAIMETGTLPLPDLMAAMRDVVTRARTGRLRNSEMTEGTITVSSLGEKGVESMTGVIYPPQVAILCVGAPQTRPWIVDGKVVPRVTLTLALSADHRVSDGRIGAKYLAEVETLLQGPEEL